MDLTSCHVHEKDGQMSATLGETWRQLVLLTYSCVSAADEARDIPRPEEKKKKL